MILIAAVDENWGIGVNGDLLARVPADLAQFKEKTMGKVVIMGRRTLESFPGKKPLPGRKNIVITTNKDYKVEGATIVHSIEEALEQAKEYSRDQIFIIGGGTIYEQLEPLCNKAYISKIKQSFEVDTFFPNLDQNSDWTLTKEEDEIISNGYKFTVCTYERN